MYSIWGWLRSYTSPHRLFGRIQLLCGPLVMRLGSPHDLPSPALVCPHPKVQTQCVCKGSNPGFRNARNMHIPLDQPAAIAHNT